MAMIAIAGGINAKYLLFDTTLLLITINFSETGSLATFNEKLKSRFPEVEGPSGGNHIIYHQRVQEAYTSQLGAPINFDTYSNHSHFQYRTGAELQEDLMHLCQFKLGYPCIPIPINKANFQYFNILYNRLMPPTTVAVPELEQPVL